MALAVEVNEIVELFLVVHLVNSAAPTALVVRHRIQL
jgi:hypothetical protein